MINKGLLEKTFEKEIVSNVIENINFILENIDFAPNNLFISNIRSIYSPNNDFYIWLLHYIKKEVENDHVKVLESINYLNDNYFKYFRNHNEIQKKEFQNKMSYFTQLANIIKDTLGELKNGNISDNLLIYHFEILKNNLNTEIMGIKSI
jgi:hypothetical protein